MKQHVRNNKNWDCLASWTLLPQKQQKRKKILFPVMALNRGGKVALFGCDCMGFREMLGIILDFSPTGENKSTVWD